MGFTTKDSGKRVSYKTGAVRDISEDKPRYDLISTLGLKRVAELMGRGAKKYGERNWEKGIPVSRMYESALRHLMQYEQGDRSEDHLAAVVFNALGILHFEEKGRKDLLDMDFYETKGSIFERAAGIMKEFVRKRPSGMMKRKTKARKQRGRKVLN